MPSKPRIRVQASSAPGKYWTRDSFQNTAAQLGYGTQNISSAGGYNFNPISRNHVQLEWMYRGSWIAKQVVDSVADDMTRAGVQYDSDVPPDDLDAFKQRLLELQVWQRLNETIKWGRLYGSALAYIVIDGADASEPLRMERVGKNQFKGLEVYDRWMVWPEMEDLVTEPGPWFGTPRYYYVLIGSNKQAAQKQIKLHYSRCIRIDGIELPFYQKMAENFWGMSVIEPLFDRLVAFDSVTTGAAQLVYKAHLRTLKVPKLRPLIAAGGKIYQQFLAQVQLIRLMQSNEGMTVLDAEDQLETTQYTFTGLSDMMIQFGQQIAGASQIPLVRLFGMSPAGMNATGESDIRNYYDSINAQQESRLRIALHRIFEAAYRSQFGDALPDTFGFSFTPLWQLSKVERAGVAANVVTAVDNALQAGIIDIATAMKELRQSSVDTGIFSNISDEDIKRADEAPPPAPEMGGPPGIEGLEAGAPGGAGHAPGAPGQPPEQDDASVIPFYRRQAEPGALMRQLKAVLAEDTPEANDLRQQIGALMKAGTPAPREDSPLLQQVRALVENALPDNEESPLRTALLAITKPGIYRKGDDSELMLAVKGLLGTVPEEKQDSPLMAQLKRLLTKDQYPWRDIGGLQVVIETPKDTVRRGNGWEVLMPADYGYISGTSSNEGPMEQMDCFVGNDTNSTKAWVIFQKDLETGEFDEHKVMLGFDNKQEAIMAYVMAFSDGRGQDRIQGVREMSIAELKRWLRDWPSGAYKAA